MLERALKAYVWTGIVVGFVTIAGSIAGSLGLLDTPHDHPTGYYDGRENAFTWVHLVVLALCAPAWVLWWQKGWPNEWKSD